MASSTQYISFADFCVKVLSIKLTPAQEVLARCAFGEEDPQELEPDLRKLALEIFGGVSVFPAEARDWVTLTLGRGSGKTTLSAAYALYRVLTADVSACKFGSVPLFPLLSFDKDMASVALAAVRSFIEEAKLTKLMQKDRGDEIRLRRPTDGVLVGIKVFAPRKGGKGARGRDLVGALVDEAQFLNPSDDGQYAINDRDVINALPSRMLPGSKFVLISTPWPTAVPTVMRELHQQNFGDPKVAVSAFATTLQMRGDDPHIRKIVEREFERDPEAARRELECDDSSFAAGSFFDPGAIAEATKEGFPIPRNRLWACAIGVDLAFRRDSTAIVAVQWDGSTYITSYIEELVPTRDNPLRPSEVFERIRAVCDKYQCGFVITDGHYREALHEHLAEHKVGIVNAPEGLLGKEEAYIRARSVLHERKVQIPRNERFAFQLKTITARPTAGGHISIKSPRKAGTGHGDMVSAWVNALHYLTYAKTGTVGELRMRPGDPGYETWRHKREMDALQASEDKYLAREDARLSKEKRRSWRRSLMR